MHEQGSSNHQALALAAGELVRPFAKYIDIEPHALECGPQSSLPIGPGERPFDDVQGLLQQTPDLEKTAWTRRQYALRDKLAISWPSTRI
jgi:hypothetical protein